MTSLLHEIFLCQGQLDEMAKRRQPTRWIVEYYRRCCRSRHQWDACFPGPFLLELLSLLTVDICCICNTVSYI